MCSKLSCLTLLNNVQRFPAGVDGHWLSDSRFYDRITGMMLSSGFHIDDGLEGSSSMLCCSLNLMSACTSQIVNGFVHVFGSDLRLASSFKKFCINPTIARS